jgi:uncharacterized OsmC-like protein
MQKAVARWSGQKVKFEIRAGSGHAAELDEPPLFGDDDGMRPTEMLLFTEIRINFKIGWEGKHDKELVENALDMAVNKYCPVDATLSKGTKISHRHS